MLTRISVVIYTAVGGLKATFWTDFLHTTIALTLLIYFTVAVLTNEHVGGISGLYTGWLMTNPTNLSAQIGLVNYVRSPRIGWIAR